MTIRLNEKYWDCECEENYIHAKYCKVCRRCGASRDEQPDAHADEVGKSESHMASCTNPMLAPVFVLN